MLSEKMYNEKTEEEGGKPLSIIRRKVMAVEGVLC